MAQTVAVNTFPGVPALTPAITYTAAGVHTNLTTIFTPLAGCWNGAWMLEWSVDAEHQLSRHNGVHESANKLVFSKRVYWPGVRPLLSSSMP